MSFFDWSQNSSGLELYDTTDSTNWDRFVDRYTNGRGNPALHRVVDIAKGHSVASVLVETRYLDADWRSEHSRFYSTTYQRYPSVAHRAHFFTKPLPSDLGDLSGMELAYKGYTVLRPLPTQPVGRTMIEPPQELDTAVRCEVVEKVDVVGWPMAVRSMPFISQDAQYMRCAHSDMWMTLRHAYLRHQVSRKLPAEIHDATVGGVVAGRQVPSEGLSVQQMMSGMTKLALSPGLLPLPASRVESEAAAEMGLFAILSRYVNSNIAPMVVSNNHVWLVVAYTRSGSAGHPGLTLYRHDDAAGPYIRVDDPWNEPNTSHQPWSTALLPLPPKIYMTAERAELVGRWWFGQALASTPAGSDCYFDAQQANALTFQTYGIDSSDYKFDLANRRNFDPVIAREYRLSSWPRNLWVVEAIDRRLRDAGQDCVLGEVLIDPTANHFPDVLDPGLVAGHRPALFWTATPDHGIETKFAADDNGAYQTGRRIVATT